MRKKLKILIFSKMAPTILTKFCGFSTFEAQQYDTIGFSRKNPWNWKNIFLIFFRLVKQGLNQLMNLVENRYLGSSLKYLEPLFIVFTLTLKLRVVHIRKN